MQLKTDELPPLARDLLLLGRRYVVMGRAIGVKLDEAFELSEWAEAIHKSLHLLKEIHPDVVVDSWSFDPKNWKNVKWEELGASMSMTGMAFLMRDEALGDWVPKELGGHSVQGFQFRSDPLSE